MEGKKNYILNNFNFITLCPSLPEELLSVILRKPQEIIVNL
jgi:hypothetical protein